MSRPGVTGAVALAVLAVVAVVLVLVLRGGAETPTEAPAATSPTSAVPSKPVPSKPVPSKAVPTPRPKTALVYYAGRRARTGELLLFAEPAADRTRAGGLLDAVRAATAGTPLDPDYTSLWRGITVDKVRLLWDGDEGYYSVRLVAGAPTGRPAGMSMREAHLAIQQVVWTLHSVGTVEAPVAFNVGGDTEHVTDLLGVPATGPYDTYLAADHGGVLSRINILAPEDGATVEGEVEVSGLAESFEATVSVRVLGPRGQVVVDDATQAEECCGRLFPWSYTLDTTEWPPGTYTLSFGTDDPVGTAQGSDGPEIDTKTVRIE